MSALTMLFIWRGVVAAVVSAAVWFLLQAPAAPQPAPPPAPSHLQPRAPMWHLTPTGWCRAADPGCTPGADT